MYWKAIRSVEACVSAGIHSLLKCKYWASGWRRSQNEAVEVMPSPT